MERCFGSLTFRKDLNLPASEPGPTQSRTAGDHSCRLVPAIARLLIGSIIAVWLNPVPASAQSDQGGQALFEEKCSPCHSIGEGDILGPDLSGVMAKRDRSWISRWIRFPEEMVRAGDPLAAELLKKWNDIPMPDTGLSQADADAIIAYLESRGEGSASEPSAQDRTSVSKPVPLGDPLVGEMLFTGEKPLQHRGTPCIACHNVAGVGALGGGNMGPDLTNVYSRYGESRLAAALGALPFPTMKALYVGRLPTSEEQGDLLAFFARADGQGLKPNPAANLFIWGIGGAGVLLLFGIMALFRPA